MTLSRLLTPLICSAALCATTLAAAQDPAATGSARALRHASVEWQTVAQHLPDPATATPEQLELAGDILRARRLPEDAVEYFGFAIQRGGDEVTMLNRMGVSELEMNQTGMARAYFKRVVFLKRKYSEGWNNLGATENMAGNLPAAINDYARAVKLNKKNAIYHANLGTAYFEAKDYDSSRKEFNTAVKLDAGVFRRGDFGGSQIHVLTADNRGRFAFEMARLAASNGQVDSMMHWLAVSSEAGFNIRDAMSGVKEFDPYRKDRRIALLIHNQGAMQTKQIASAGHVPAIDGAVPD